MIVFLILLTIHLLNELYTPEDKDYIQAWYGAAIAGAASLLGGLFNRNSQEKYNDRMIRLQQETNHMNYLMNRENNVYNSMLAKEMFNLENEYNDPKNQMARLRAAGINPFVAAGGSNIGQVEGRADTVPAQSPIPFQNPAIGTVAPTFDFAAPMAQLASAIGSIAKAKKDIGENDRANASFDALLDGLRAEADLKNEQVLQARFDNAMNFKYGDERTKYQVENLKAQWAKANQDMNESEARTWLTQTQAMLAEIERDTKDAEFKAVLPYLGPMAKQKYENMVKEGRAIDAQAAAGFASANASNTQAQLNVSKKRAQDIVNKYLPQLSAWQVVTQQYETYGKALVNKKTAQDMVLQAKRFLPEIKKLFAEGSQVVKNIEYLQGQIDKIPHEIDKLDSETWRNFCGGMNDMIRSMQGVVDLVDPW